MKLVIDNLPKVIDASSDDVRKLIKESTEAYGDDLRNGAGHIWHVTNKIAGCLRIKETVNTPEFLTRGKARQEQEATGVEGPPSTPGSKRQRTLVPPEPEASAYDEFVVKLCQKMRTLKFTAVGPIKPTPSHLFDHFCDIVLLPCGTARWDAFLGDNNARGTWHCARRLLLQGHQHAGLVASTLGPNFGGRCPEHDGKRIHCVQVFLPPGSNSRHRPVLVTMVAPEIL